MGFSPIFISLARVNGLAVTLYRTSIAASVLLIPFLLPRANRPGKATRRPSLRMTMAIASLGSLLYAANSGPLNTAVTMIPASTAVFLVIMYAQANLPPSRVSTILLAWPLLVFILASISLREQPSAIQIVDMVALFGGIVLANRG